MKKLAIVLLLLLPACAQMAEYDKQATERQHHADAQRCAGNEECMQRRDAEHRAERIRQQEQFNTDPSLQESRAGDR